MSLATLAPLACRALFVAAGAFALWSLSRDLRTLFAMLFGE